jgi:hypothetical protein
MAWALAIDVEAQIAPTVTSKDISRIIVSFCVVFVSQPQE